MPLRSRGTGRFLASAAGGATDCLERGRGSTYTGKETERSLLFALGRVPFISPSLAMRAGRETACSPFFDDFENYYEEPFAFRPRAASEPGGVDAAVRREQAAGPG